jgi:hypothetical protein
MTNEATNKKDDNFEDLFADDVFEETEKSAKDEELASKGEADLGQTSGNKSDSSKYLIYGVGGVIIVGVCWALYRQFVPAAPQQVRHKVGPTRILKVNRVRPVVVKPKAKEVKKVEDGFLINKKNLKQMISNFTVSTNDALNKSQDKLYGRMDTMQSSFDKTYQNTQKEFAQVDQQLNLLSHQQINLAKMQKKQQLKEVGSFGTMLKDQNKKMTTLTNKIDDLSVQFAKMNKTLANVNQSIVKTQVQLKLVIAEKAAEAQKMTLRAVVPGRAWLVNGKGQTLTISVGNELPYYGKVLKIDSKANTVTMSTGYVFS